MQLPLSHSQRERLAYLELRAFFIGELRRGDLEARFSIKPAAATRDISAYRKQASDNLEYDRYIKAYIPTSRFRPIYGFSAERVLSWLLHGFGDGQNFSVARSIPCAGPGELVQPNFEVLGEITRSIHAGRDVDVLGLHVPVNNAFFVCRRQTVTGLNQDVEQAIRVDHRAIDEVVEGLAREELHGQIDPAII